MPARIFEGLISRRFGVKELLLTRFGAFGKRQFTVKSLEFSPGSRNFFLPEPFGSQMPLRIKRFKLRLRPAPLNAERPGIQMPENVPRADRFAFLTRE
ncbi:hypothetical protein EVA_17438, partial [gut metagenome]